MKVAVTGAFSYSGKYIARRLLARRVQVVTLTGHAGRPDPFGGQVEIFPLDFTMPEAMEAALNGIDVLVNTYWIRFDRGRNTQERAVQNTLGLLSAAERAGVRRIVHISITNPSAQSALPYFRGKAQNEKTVETSGMSYAILRPTVLFGAEDILINNIAFFLRYVPFFFVPGDGSYQLQPVYVDDLAEMVEDAVFRSDSYVTDAVGPETFTFREMVALIGRTIGHHRPLLSADPDLVLWAARLLGRILDDVVLTPQEIEGLMANLLVSARPALARTKLSEWLELNKRTIGVRYASELRRHYL